jgi:hypothetical protein
MPAMTSFQQLLSEFAEATGLALVPDAQDACSLEAGDLVLTVQYLRESGEIAFFAPVAEAEADGSFPPPVLRKALELAYDGRKTGGAFLGLFSDALILSLRLPAEHMDARDFAVRLTAFAEAAEGLAAELAAAETSAARVDPPAPVPSPAAEDGGIFRIEP